MTSNKNFVQRYLIMKKILFCFSISVLLWSCQHDATNTTDNDATTDVSKNEKLHPENFLVMKGTQHASGPKQFLSDVKIINTASKTGYTNVFILIHMLDAQNNIVDSSSNIVYSKIAAGDSVSFKLKTKLTKGTHIKLKIEKADTF